MPAFAGIYYKPTGFLGGLFPTPLYHLGRLFPTRLYHLGGCSRRRSTTYIPVGVHPCRRTSMQAGLRRAATGILPSRRIQDFLSINDGGGWGQEFA